MGGTVSTVGLEDIKRGGLARFDQKWHRLYDSPLSNEIQSSILLG